MIIELRFGWREGSSSGSNRMTLGLDSNRMKQVAGIRQRQKILGDLRGIQFALSMLSEGFHVERYSVFSE